ncbi:SIS domain-containing protein [Paraburkholderia susongensis]|uniref:Glutamine--fructose-6-phosphate aminotransferase [isomerizing] n=1 Tax=Paraburkholderia susongensis TaxID=1515439 RepID=A0A1X7LTC0_9BURK|nr:SIS domain-containing protein [Paraburkholderia susongensis]
MFRNIDSILVLACDTSYYAGLTAKYWFGSIAKIRTDVETVSEYHYLESVSSPRVRRDDLAVGRNHRHARCAQVCAVARHDARAMCGVATSAMVSLTELGFPTHAGREIGGTSTKTFTTQFVGLFILAVTLGKLRDSVNVEQEAAYLKPLRYLPVALNGVLGLEPQIIAWSEEFARKEGAFFLGRGLSRCGVFQPYR